MDASNKSFVHFRAWTHQNQNLPSKATGNVWKVAALHWKAFIKIQIEAFHNKNLCKRNLKTENQISEFLASIGGANCSQSLAFVHGSNGAFWGGWEVGGLDCLGSFSSSTNLNNCIKK